MYAHLVFILVALVAVTYVASQKNLPVYTPEDRRYGCLKNEIWQSCGRVCEPNCLFQNIRLDYCGSQCNLGTEGCRCNEGYVRDAYSKHPICLLPKDCTVTSVSGQINYIYGYGFYIDVIPI